MNQLIGIGMGLVVLFAVIMIGVGISEMTYDAVSDTVANTTVLDNSRAGLNTAFTTLTTFLPVVVIAGVGALALGYLLGFGRTMG